MNNKIVEDTNNSWVKTINIMFKTNIPGKNDYQTLTRDAIYNPLLNATETTETSKYPYMTDKYDFPLKVLTRMSYPELMSFFFNREEFILVLTTGQPQINGGALTQPEIERTDMDLENRLNIEAALKSFENVEDKNDVISKNGTLNRNTFIMIQLLLRTRSPFESNKTSYVSYINGGPEIVSSTIVVQSPSFLTSYLPFLKSETEKNGFCYLKQSNKVYTVTESIQLNDTLNNPQYQALRDIYLKVERKGPEIDRQIVINTFRLLAQINKLTRERKDTINAKKRNTSDIDFMNDFNTEIVNSDIMSITKGSSKDMKSMVMKLKSIRFSNLYDILDSALKKKDSSSSRTIPYSSTLLNQINNLFSALAKVETLKLIRNKYFSNGSAFSDDSFLKYETVEMARDVYKTNMTSLNGSKDSKVPYQNFTEFYDSLKSFTRRASAPFQEKIDTYLLDKDESLTHLCDNNKCMFVREDGRPEYVGVTFYSDSQKKTSYEMYLFISVIGGELNDQNIHNISCSFKNERFGVGYTKTTSNGPYILKTNGNGKGLGKANTNDSGWKVDSKHFPYIDVNEMFDKPKIVSAKGGYRSRRYNRMSRYTKKKHVNRFL